MTRGLIQKTVIILCLLSSFFLEIQGKVYSKNIPVMNFRRESGWIFIDRINLDSGKLDIELRVKINAPDFRIGSQFQFVFAAVPSDIWEDQVNAKCDGSKLTRDQLDRKSVMEKNHLITLNYDNNFESKSFINFSFQNGTQLNFVLRDCSQAVLKQNFGRTSSIQINLKTFVNGQYLSSSEGMYHWLLPSLFVLCLIALAYLKYINKEDEQNWIKFILRISLWIALGATVFKYIGFVIYAYISGEDYQFFDVMYLLLYSISDSVIIVLLLLLAFGWTVTFHSTKDFDLYVPLASMLGMINVIMTTLNKVTDGDHNKYHVFDSIPAYIMVFFRLLGFAIFVVGALRSLVGLKEDDKKTFKYFVHLTILGTIYLTFIPISLVLVQYIDSKNRKEGMFFLIEAGKYGLSMWLGYLCGSKNSVYRNIIEGSFMQKGDKYF